MTPLFVLLSVLHPFVTDGCTHFPDGTWNQPKLWEDCCIEHDLYFWAGGTPEARRKTDLRLRDCVKEKGQPEIAELIYLGVRLGSHSPAKIKGKEWGNAWAEPGYGKLRPEQVLDIKSELLKISIPREMELRFISKLEEDSQ